MSLVQLVKRGDHDQAEAEGASFEARQEVGYAMTSRNGAGKLGGSDRISGPVARVTLDLCNIFSLQTETSA